ncbi:hypothetical protein KBB96_02845 [Luteolibacter ambystomatis]|uniref:Uncharacterized protein n=1 Tax=Luteolibacter ambystomatis TaxID=2824561 RepID=A0A975PFD8_9BACT|nr:hypothetical protein [Luteolibacter ambystomatis]QUE51835.1 hypothetical protein KBB96_02845 [Luteolibacter ambystomatis]
MGKLIHLLGLCTLLPLGLTAQTIGPAPGPAAPVAPATKPAPAPSPEKGPTVPALDKAQGEAATSGDLPSRYAGSDVGAYVETLATVFAIRSRTTDPFGQVQDTTAKPIKPKVTHTAVARAAAIPTTPYSEIVAQIQVNTVIPAEERFFCGSRVFKKGDRFPISFRGRNYPTEITEVNADYIRMKNLDTSETGLIKFEKLPPGMTRASQSDKMLPGFQSQRPDSPLEIESGPPSQVGGLPQPGGFPTNR